MKELFITAKSLDDIRRAVSKLARQINAPDSLLPTYGTSIDLAHPHIEVDADGFHFVVVERGRERDRKTTADPIQLLYWVFESVTFCMASEYELEHRVKARDSRRGLFQKQEELLGQLDSSWRKRKAEEHQRILEEHPFDDASLIRAQYCRELRASGMRAGAAWDLACREFPQQEGKQNN